MTIRNGAFAFETGQATHQGLVRQRNEDSIIADPDYGLWAVADGMGGHDDGDHASQSVAAALASVGSAVSPGDLLARIQDRLDQANRELVAYGADQGSVVGSTVVVLLAFERRYACVWSGDSRIYLLRDGQLRQLTKDHSEVQELIDRGVLNDDEARTWSGRNAITKALGVDERLEVEVVQGTLAPDDVFLLCSDGLTAHVPDDELEETVAALAPDAAVKALLETTLERGATDNVSVVIVRCEARASFEPTVLQPGTRPAGADRS